MRTRFTFRFSLRLFLAIVGMVGVVGGLFGRYWADFSRERELAAKFAAANCEIRFESVIPFPLRPVTPTFVEDHMQRVVYLDAFLTEMTNEQVQEIYQFKQLKNLRLAWGSLIEYTPIRNREEDGIQANGVGTSDEAYRGLGKLKNLEVLRLSYCPLGDNFKAEISSLTKLKHLEVGRTFLDDAGMREICRLNELEILDVWDTRVTDAGFDPMPHWPRLRYFNIGESLVDFERRPAPLTDRGMRFVANCPNLEHFDATFSQVGDQLCLHLGNAHKLRELDLSHTQVTGKNFSRWEGLRELEDLRLDYTLVTDEALDKLPALPQLKHVSIRYCNTSEHILQYITRFPSIRTYSVSTYNFDDYSDLIKQHPKIEQVQ